MHRLQFISTKQRFSANAPSADLRQAHELHWDVLTDEAPSSKFDEQVIRLVVADHPLNLFSLGSESLLKISSCQP